jgi:hypothetical protein
MTKPEIIAFIQADQRNCRSNNMQKFFRNSKNWDLTHVIRFEGQLWFASIGWDPDESGFAGVKVREVACYGTKAKTGYPSWQKPGSWTDVSEWFWQEYKEAGVVAFPDIWHIKIPALVTSKEAHMI